MRRSRQNEQANIVRERLVGYVYPDDSADLRRSAVRSLSINTRTSSDLGRHKKVRDSCDLILDFITVDDSPDIRRFAFYAILVRLIAESRQGEYGHLTIAHQEVVKYIQRDDPKWLLTKAAVVLTISGRILIGLGRYGKAEEILREANEVDQGHAESWAYRARSVLLQASDERISEAGMFAKRAVELNPDSPNCATCACRRAVPARKLARGSGAA